MPSRSPFYACLVFFLLFPLLAMGQFPGNRRGGGAPPKPIDIKGSVVAIQGNVIGVKSDDKGFIKVLVLPATQTHLVGTATADYLQSRVYVEFVADLDKAGATQKDIEQLTVFSPSADRPAGLFPEGAASKKDKDADAGDGGKKAKKAAKKKSKPAADAGGDAGGGDAMFGVGASKSGAIKPPAVCTVRGAIKTVKGNHITVAAGKTMVKATLAENPTIDVDMTDCRAATQGDSISVTGQQMPNMVVAESVRIDCTNPLSGPKKRGSHANHAKTDKPAAEHGSAKKTEKSDSGFGDK